MIRLYTDYTNIVNQSKVINMAKYVAFRKFLGYRISLSFRPLTLITKEGAVNSDPNFLKNTGVLNSISIKNNIVHKNLIKENLDPNQYSIFRITKEVKNHFKKEGLWCLPYTSSLFYGYEDPFFFDETASPLLQIHHNHSVVFNRKILVKKYTEDKIQVLNSPYFA